MEVVFLLQHVHMIDDIEDVKVIGIYSTQGNAEKALSNLKKVIGFRENPDGFHIGRHVLDKTSWLEGFITS